MIRNRISRSRNWPRTKKGAPSTNDASVIQFSVPMEKGFHFFNGFSQPTGVYATSMIDFLDQLKKVDLKSVQFHSDRNDFSRWLREVVNDSSLAGDFDGLHAVELSGEDVRSRLVELTEKRCRELADAQNA